MGSRDRIAGVAEVNSVRPDRGGGLRCRHRPAPSVFAGARATSLTGWQALSLRRCCAGEATHSDGCSIRAPDECVANPCYSMIALAFVERYYGKFEETELDAH